MHITTIPAASGSCATVCLNLPGLRLSVAEYRAGTQLPTHTHPNATLGFMLRGAFQTHIRRQSHLCTPGTWWVEPPEERHSNHIGGQDSSVLLIEPQIGIKSWVGEFSCLFAEQRLTRSASAHVTAIRIEEEMRRADALSPLAIEAAVIGLLVPAARASADVRISRSASRAILQARELVHARFRTGISLQELAGEVGISASYLTRAFKSAFGISVGAYARQLRLSWAIECMRSTNTPFSMIAHQAGYADQSHMTRDCQRAMRMTPAQIRGSRP